MSSLQRSSSSYARPNGNRYANIIATVSLAAFVLLWGLIWNRLENLDTRIRSIEQDVAAIKGVYDAEQYRLKRPISQSPGRAISPGSMNPR